jgi:hypothetical protein
LKQANKSLKVVFKNDNPVHFYPADKYLCNNFSGLISEGLKNEQTCIIIARYETIIRINKHLRINQVNLMNVIDQGKYIIIDSEDLINNITDKSNIDFDKFMITIGSIIREASKSYKSPKVFVEMLDVLLEKGNIEAMKQLEFNWNKLHKKTSFSLYCAYPERLYDRASTQESELFDELCSYYNN